MRPEILAALLTLAIQSALADGQNPAVPYQTLRLDIQPGITAPIAGDFTGDRIPDLVVHMSGEIRIYPGDGNGGFGAAVVTPIGVTETRQYPHAAVSGDFNRDGKLDFFAFQRVFLGNGDGTLRLAATIDIEDQPRVIDINRDGIPDLAGTAGQRFLILLGSEDGRFCRSTSPCRPSKEFTISSVAALGDVNRDGSPDLVTAVFDRSYAEIETTLSIANAPQPENSADKVDNLLNWSWGPAKAIALEDVTGDGWPDLIAVCDRIIVAPGLANGSFGKPYVAADGTPTAYFGSYFDAVFADFNRDGRMDIGYLITSDEADGGFEAGILSGDGQGKFSQSTRLQNGFRPSGAVGGDWNGDGLPDLVFGDATTLFLSLSTPFALSRASRQTAIAPGSLATIRGLHLAPAEVSAPRFAVPPKNLGGVSIRVYDGSSSYDADLLSVSPDEVHFRVPPELPPGLLRGRVTASGGVYDFSLWVRPQAPGIFTTDGMHAVAAIAGSASTIDAVLYATGLNGAPASGITILADETRIPAASVLSMPGLAGLDLVSVRIPRPAACQSNGPCWDPWVRVKVGEVQSNGVVLGLTALGEIAR